uniref:Succinate--CoA ligase [ADP-forming] subunit beta, mitochondrial n=1 Tax=Globodera rostochiensis TaxID=31243 RepID=A0A914GWR9_GLORO
MLKIFCAFLEVLRKSSPRDGEYQSKQLLRQNGCTVQDFFLVEEGVRATDKNFDKTAFAEYVIKAQILAGGRGKGRFIDCPKDGGGIRITKSIEKAISHVNGMLGKRLVTQQTSDQGVLVNKVMVAESITINRETYLSIIMDPTSTGPVIVACPIGGMDIEEIAINQPELIFKERISVLDGVTEEQCQRVAKFLKFSEKALANASEQIRRLYDLFIEVDASQIEINPFAETDDARVFCVDAKLNFDDNASFRQSDIFGMETFDEMDFRETMAKKCGLSYVGLDGNIACMVNGAGLAMATMDIIKLHGGEPANFLDLGGGATVQQVKEACRIILTDSAKLRVIFVNVFCGILRCDVVAQGILEAMANSKLDIPVVIRLKGTRMAEAKELIAGASHLGIFECYDSFEEAAKRAVRLSHGEDAELGKQREKYADRA